MAEEKTETTSEPENPVEEPAKEEPTPTEAEKAEDPQVAPEAEAAPSAETAKQSRQRKRLPRALRPQRTRPTREKSAERKPISRLPKPERERGRTQERRGIVVSDAMDKTIVVRVDTTKAHQRYKKVVRRSKKFRVHDERNEAKVGDVVRIVETRPLSATKHWRLAEIVEAAK